MRVLSIETIPIKLILSVYLVDHTAIDAFMFPKTANENSHSVKDESYSS